MASNQTENFGLNQWAPGDQVVREEFNADNFKVDAALARAGNCRIVTGNYVGNGRSGTGINATGLDFANTLGKAPELLIVRGDKTMGHGLILLKGLTRCFYTLGHCWSSLGTLDITWTPTGVSWSGEKAEYQYSIEGFNYYYVAFG